MSSRTRASSAVDNVPEGRADWVPGTAGNPNISVPGVDLVTVSTAVMVANRLYYEPVYVATTITLDRLICEITAGVAGNARMGIYNADRDWQPTSLVVDGGQFATGVAAVINLAINVTLQPNRYLFAIHADAGPTVRFTRGGARYPGYGSSLGATPFTTQLFIALAYGPLADPGIPWNTVTSTTTATVHQVFCRVSVP